MHHIRFRSQGGKDWDSNLITLCAPCHLNVAHGPNARTFRELFRAYLWLLYVEGRSMFIPEVAKYLDRIGLHPDQEPHVLKRAVV